MSTYSDAKPRLRGWFHAVMSPVAFLAGLVLVVVAPSLGLRVASAIYTVAAVLLFTNSAVYHKGPWSPRIKQLFRRLDHSFIFVFIAGTYTPITVALLRGSDRACLLGVIWGLALVGLLFRVLWLAAPRALYTVLYVLMGWAAVWWMAPMYHAGGPWPLVWLLVGGLFYTAGALVYGMKRPNPWPTTFGFHEIFHLGTLIAAVCHYAAILVAMF